MTPSAAGKLSRLSCEPTVPLDYWTQSHLLVVPRIDPPCGDEMRKGSRSDVHRPSEAAQACELYADSDVVVASVLNIFFMGSGLTLERLQVSLWHPEHRAPKEMMGSVG